MPTGFGAEGPPEQSRERSGRDPGRPSAQGRHASLSARVLNRRSRPDHGTKQGGNPDPPAQSEGATAQETGYGGSVMRVNGTVIPVANLGHDPSERFTTRLLEDLQ